MRVRHARRYKSFRRPAAGAARGDATIVHTAGTAAFTGAGLMVGLFQ
jgi:hypothetical protein